MMYQPMNIAANEYDASNPYVEGCGEYEFMPRLDDSTQYSTVYRTRQELGGGSTSKPVGTLSRRPSIYRTGAVWTLYATDGTLLRQWFFAPRYAALARGTVTKLVRFAEGR